MPSNALTERQQRFVASYVANGERRRSAAREAGYADSRCEGDRLLRLPHILAAIHAERERQFQGDLGGAALKTMFALLDSEETPAHVRFQTAKFVLEIAGHRPSSDCADDQPEKSLVEMTCDELAATVRRSTAALEALAA